MTPRAADAPPDPRAPILDAFEALDDEAFNFCVAQLWQIAKERGGFRDKVRLAALERACSDYITALENSR